MSRIPGTPGTPGHIPPVPAGGVLLNAPQQVPPTQTVVTFYGCSIGFFVVLNEDNVCQGYKLVIQDPRNAHVYEAGIGEDVIDEWRTQLSAFPKIGEKPDGVE